MSSLDFSVFALVISCLRGAIPLVFASLGGLLSERTGTVQIALEAFMLIGALVGAINGYYFHSSWVGLLAAVLAGALLALIMGVFVLIFEADHIITGTALNIFVVGVAPLITKYLFDSTGSTPGLELADRFSFEPFVILFLLVAGFCYLYYFTKIGLWVRFCGELPAALTAAGIHVMSVRWWGLAATGALAGLAGGFLSLFLSSSYAPHMTAGRGFISLAALIFGRWQPLPTVLVCLGFSAFDVIANSLQGQSFIPVQFIQILPYLLTIIALSGFFGQSRAPRFLGNQS